MAAMRFSGAASPAAPVSAASAGGASNGARKYPMVQPAVTNAITTRTAIQPRLGASSLTAAPLPRW